VLYLHQFKPHQKEKTMRHFVLREFNNAALLSLEARLRLHGISTIPAVEIEQYKLKKVKEMPKANFLGSIADYCNKSADEMRIHTERLLWTSFWLSLCGVLLSFFGTITRYFHSAEVSFPTLGVSALLVIVCAVYLLGSILTIRTSACWARVPWRMHEYEYPVPAVILERVHTVKAFCRLSVLELKQDSVLVDPILVAFDSNTGEECYIGIWEDDRVIV
jgi:hypothetical protein